VCIRQKEKVDRERDKKRHGKKTDREIERQRESKERELERRKKGKEGKKRLLDGQKDE
jgi:hypothetical protein